MKYLIRKDKKRRILVKKYELKRLVLKSIISDQNLALIIRENSYNALVKLKNNTALSRIKNRCIVSGRSKSIFSKYKVSRFTFKMLFTSKQLSGFKHRIW